MSAIPLGAYTPQESHPFLAAAVEQTDKAILSNQEVYNLKGGDQFFLLKSVIGVGSALAFIKLSGRQSELTKFSLESTTFFWANVFGLSSMALVQKFQLCSSGNAARYRLHQLALFNRFLVNWNFIHLNKKKPKIH